MGFGFEREKVKVGVVACRFRRRLQELKGKYGEGEAETKKVALLPKIASNNGIQWSAATLFRGKIISEIGVPL